MNSILDRTSAQSAFQDCPIVRLKPQLIAKTAGDRHAEKPIRILRLSISKLNSVSRNSFNTRDWEHQKASSKVKSQSINQIVIYRPMRFDSPFDIQSYAFHTIRKPLKGQGKNVSHHGVRTVFVGVGVCGVTSLILTFLWDKTISSTGTARGLSLNTNT